MRVTRNAAPVEGDAEAWGDGTRERFTQLAGSRLLREEDGNAVVSVDGREDVMYPGWLVIRPDGGGDGEVQFASPQQVGGGQGCAWSPAA